MLALNWLGDSLDGTLARVRNQQRPTYGCYIDHIVDAFNTAVIGIGIVANTTVALFCAGLLTLMAVRFGRNLHRLARMEPQAFRLRRTGR